MIDGGRIVGGVAIALALGIVPLWVVSVRAAGQSESLRPATGSCCLETAPQMRRHHPELLAGWRIAAVRNGKRVHTTIDGRRFRISLDETCLGCHGSAADFCDRCHSRFGVTLSCWTCH